jgi:ribosomal protein S18 acetylase RimI-like enzyme
MSKNLELSLVPCTSDYWEFVRMLRTDPRVIGGFIEQRAISADEQIDFMKDHWHEYLIALKDQRDPCGFVGVIDGDIRVCTHPDYQGVGVGKFMIQEIAKRFPNAVAKIKTENLASKALFEASGFENTFLIYQKRSSGS